MDLLLKEIKNAVRTALKKRLKDNYNVFIENDMLFVDIFADKNDTYRYNTKLTYSIVVNGFNVQGAVIDICNSYRAFLIKKHFK